MRRSGSSSCMLRPRASLSNLELTSVVPPSITMVNTRRLPNYSAERYYVLSEVEMHANSVRFLCDYDDDGTYAESLGAADRGGRPPRNVVLYLLWRPDGDGKYGTAREFAEGPIVDGLRRLISLRGGDASSLDWGEVGVGVGGTNGGNNVASPPVPPAHLQAAPSSGGSGEGGAGALCGDSGFGWPSSPPTSPRSPLDGKKKPLLRSSLTQIAILPTLEEPAAGGSASTLSLSSSTQSVAAGGTKGEEPAAATSENPADDTASPPPPPAAATTLGTTTPASPNRPPPAVGLRRRVSASSLRPPPSALRRSASAIFREQEEVVRDRTRTRVYIAVDRLSPPPPKYDDDKEADVQADTASTTRPREGAVNDRGERHDVVPEKESGAKSDNITDGTDKDGPGEGESKVDPSRLRHHKVEVALAESLAKYVASSRRLRPIVDGITVGVASSEVRSAATPALVEATLGSVTHGAPERRRGARYLRLPWIRLRGGKGGGRAEAAAWEGGGVKNQGVGGNAARSLGDEADAGAEGVDPSKSAVGIAASHPDDLVGSDPDSEPDASQGVLQSVTVAEWGGNGDASCFAKRAMTYWRERHGLPGPDGDGKEDSAENGAEAVAAASRRRRKGGRGGRGGAAAQNKGVEDSDELATTMVVAFLVCVVSYVWSIFGEQIRAMIMEDKS